MSSRTSLKAQLHVCLCGSSWEFKPSFNFIAACLQFLKQVNTNKLVYGTPVKNQNLSRTRAPRNAGLIQIHSGASQGNVIDTRDHPKKLCRALICSWAYHLKRRCEWSGSGAEVWKMSQHAQFATLGYFSQWVIWQAISFVPFVLPSRRCQNTVDQL